MTWFEEEAAESTGATTVDLLRLVAAAYLARYKGTSRMHTESDLRIYLGWCADRCESSEPPAAPSPTG
jgi:hypothetical protein